MISICAIAKNESRYIREWVEFHRLVGVEKITVYDNASTDSTTAVLRSLDVEVIDWPMPNPSQSAAYWDCIHKRKGQQEWVAFIDCDEFLWSPKFATISAAVDHIASVHYHAGAIGVNWTCFGAGNETEYRSAPTIERFTWRPHLTSPVNQHIKSIVWMDQDVVACGSTPHHFDTTFGTVSETGERFHGPHSPAHSSDILRINHYSSKSRPEWEARCALGKPDRSDINPDPIWWNQVQPMEVEDHEIQRYLPQLKERLECLP